MKLFVLLTVLSIYLLAQGNYERGKIDMHGGKNEYSNDGYQNGFKNSRMGVSLFLDKNSSKNSNSQTLKNNNLSN